MCGCVGVCVCLTMVVYIVPMTPAINIETKIGMPLTEIQQQGGVTIMLRGSVFLRFPLGSEALAQNLREIVFVLIMFLCIITLSIWIPTNFRVDPINIELTD